MSAEACLREPKHECVGRDGSTSFATLVGKSTLSVDSSEVRDDGLDEGKRRQELFQVSLREWAIKHGIKRRALTGLLKLLRSHDCLSHLPKDGRTLLRTPRQPRNQFSIMPMDPGEYSHFGLAVGLQHSLRHVQDLPGVLPLVVNVDGLPL